MRLLCPAKINLHLRVGPLRDDGFHSLLSWFCTAGLFDTLIMQRGGPSAGMTDSSVIALTCDQPDVPSDHRNLVVKVAQGWAVEARQVSGASVDPIVAHLQKRIPAGAGLGGGSSDGARALLGLNLLWRTGRAADFLSGFAARFGSDLPFFLHGPSSVCTGRGELVRPVAQPAPKWVLLILPSIHMPTADVYGRFDAMKLGRTQDIEAEPDWLAWSKLAAQDLLDRLVNDLEAPAFAISPTLMEHRNKAQKLLGRPVRMSGSGSSLFTLYDTRNEAETAESKLIHDGRFVRVQAVELAPDIRDDLTTQIGNAR